MDKGSFFENLSIYGANLSVYYFASVLVTIFSVLLAWWYTKGVDHMDLLSQKEKKNSEIGSSNAHSQSVFTTFKKSERNETEEEFNDSDSDGKDEIISKIKLGRRSLLEEEVAATLTQEQMQEEREVEKQQLEAIFKLLQNQEDKFQVSSLEELQDQLKLYRP